MLRMASAMRGATDSWWILLCTGWISMALREWRSEGGSERGREGEKRCMVQMLADRGRTKRSANGKNQLARIVPPFPIPPSLPPSLLPFLPPYLLLLPSSGMVLVTTTNSKFAQSCTRCCPSLEKLKEGGREGGREARWATRMLEQSSSHSQVHIQAFERRVGAHRDAGTRERGREGRRAHRARDVPRVCGKAVDGVSPLALK